MTLVLKRSVWRLPGETSRL
jgi:hypothetical protein